MAQLYEWRAVWTKPGHKKPQVKIFQRHHNLLAHIEWLTTNAYRLVAVERRAVGAWEELHRPDLSGPADANPESGSAEAHTAGHSPDPAT